MIKSYLIHYLVNFKFILKFPFYSKYPITIFHHIPKCGGESIGLVLSKWFLIIADIGLPRYVYTLPFIKFKSLRSFCCLKGHYHLQGYHLWQVYPKIYNNPNYRLITFLRDPLETIISKYYYAVRTKQIDSSILTLKQFVFLEPTSNIQLSADPLINAYLCNNVNYISNQLGCTYDNYKECIDNYYFVGILEQAQDSLDILANKLGKKKVAIPHINKTKREKNNAAVLTEKDIQLFKKKNSLDYLIYNYSLNHFRG